MLRHKRENNSILPDGSNVTSFSQVSTVADLEDEHRAMGATCGLLQHLPTLSSGAAAGFGPFGLFSSATVQKTPVFTSFL